MTMHLEDVAKELDRILLGRIEQEILYRIAERNAIVMPPNLTQDWPEWVVEELLALRQRVRDTLMSDRQEQGFRDTRP